MTYITLIIFLLGFLSCSDSKHSLEDNTLFSIIESTYNDNINSGETASFSFKIKRPEGYDGKYFISYLQNTDSGDGLGKLVLNNATLKQSTNYALTGDNITLYYTPISENYHQLNLSVSNSFGNQVDFSVIFNKSKKGTDDKEFEVILLPYKDSIKIDETREVKFVLKPSKVYLGKYYFKYNQLENQGLGILQYFDEYLQQNKPMQVIEDTICLKYSANTTNYHQLNFTFFDEQQDRELKKEIVFNKDKKGEDDKVFSLIKEQSKDIIHSGESCDFRIIIQPSPLYSGRYYLSYKQKAGSGKGEISYNNTILAQDVPVELISTNIKLNYKAISENYHQIDFTLKDELNHSVDIPIIFNEDKKGIDDNLFSAAITPDKTVINKDETIGINLKLTPSKVYSGKYFLKYAQADGNGLGKLKYNGNYLQAGNPLEIDNDNLQLYYTASTPNYHQMDFIVYDELGQQKHFQVILNEDKKDADDKDFSISVSNPKITIKENETNEIDFKLIRSGVYNGKYFIRYYQYDGNGLGKIKYNGNIIQPGQPVEITSSIINLLYTAVTINYHQLNFEIYDEIGHLKKLQVIFNEDKRGIDDHLCIVKTSVPQSNLTLNETVNFQLQIERSKIYSGRYYIRYNQSSQYGQGRLFYGNTFMQPDNQYLITDDKVSLFYTADNSLCHQLDFTIIDEDNRKVYSSVNFNEDKRGLTGGFEFKNVEYDKYFAQVAYHVLLINLNRLDNKQYDGLYYLKWRMIKGTGHIGYPGGIYPENTKVQIIRRDIYNKDNRINLFHMIGAATNYQLQQEVEITLYDDTGYSVSKIFKYSK